jgi:NAD(P)-dependent dehydrogenase (short-subunit alcohol dehydrogenase family)
LLTGKSALVTGASRGIGRAVASLLAAHGARVAIHFHRDESAAAAVRDDLPGEEHVLVQADLGDPEAARRLPDQAAQKFGRLDMVINNAGIYEPHPLDELDFAAWRAAWERTLAVNLHGPAHVMYGAVPHLKAAGGGHIVNISSRGAFRGEPEAPAYGASKAGLNALSQSLALALGPHGIHVVVVAPGWVATDMTREYLDGLAGDAIRAQSPFQRIATVQEVAQVVSLVVSGRADALSGGIIDVNCASHLRG